MITQTEFYFVRHGQTDHNKAIMEMEALGNECIFEDQGDIPLNDTGRMQAQEIESLIAALPVKTICLSPMQRALETHSIAAARVSADRYIVDDLAECCSRTWVTMERLGDQAHLSTEEPLRSFMSRVIQGINHSLSYPGPVMIVAHGGIHLAICSIMGIEDHDWILDNCGVVHFTISDAGGWLAKKLNT